MAAGIGAIAIIGVVALSAAAGSSPPAVPSVPSTSAPVVESTPTPSDTPTTVPLVAVPELVGLSLGEAAALLAERGLVVGGVTRVDAASAADTVLAAEPGAGAQRAPGSPVDLRVASGNNAVPAVAGLTLVDATALLAAAGFGFEMRDGGPGTPGQVIAISPGAGEVVPLGSTIVLTVARQQMVAPSASPSPTTTPTPTPSGSATP